jgi:hypothetical protein
MRMRFLIEWFLERRSSVAIGAAVFFLLLSLILRYGFDIWWPWGIGIAVVLGVVGLFAGKS